MVKCAGIGTLAAVMIGLVLLLLLDTPVVDALVREDGPIEFLGAGCLLAGSVLLAMATISMCRQDVSRIMIASFVLVAVALFVAAGEEISWGQRILDIDTPRAIAAINVQGEINFHNLYGDEDGQNVSQVLYKAFWMVLGVVLPVLALLPPFGPRVRRHLPVVPVWLAVLFVAQQASWHVTEFFWRADPGVWGGTHRGAIGGEPFRVETTAEIAASGATSPAGLDEIMEANVQILLFVAAATLAAEVWRRNRRTGRHSIAARVARARQEFPDAVTEPVPERVSPLRAGAVRHWL